MLWAFLVERNNVVFHGPDSATPFFTHNSDFLYDMMAPREVCPRKHTCECQ